MDYRQAEIRGPDYKYGLRYMTIEQYKILFFFFLFFLIQIRLCYIERKMKSFIVEFFKK